MNTYAAAALITYFAGAGVFLLAWRDKVLGGWFQKLFTALTWPILLIVVLTKKDLP